MEISFFGGRVQALSMNQVDSYLEEVLVQGKKTRIYTLNIEVVTEAKDKAWIRGLLNSGNLRLANGIGLVMGARINKIPLEERVTGFDVSIHLLQIAQGEGYKAYSLGAKKGIVQRVVQEVEEDHSGLAVVGSYHGYCEKSPLDQDLTQDEEETIEEIQRPQADIALVGLGFPVQEVLTHKASQRLDRGVWIGNGGVSDTLAKERKQAPEIFIRLHLEWFYRLIRNLSRWKRQLAIPKLLTQVTIKKNVAKIVREDFNENESKGY